MIKSYRWPLILLAVITIAVAAMFPPSHQTVPTALAQRPTPDPARGPTDPSRDCWNGVLQYEIPHCYLFEEAEKDGKIKIESIYLEPSGALHFFLSRTEPIDQTLADYFEAKAHQYMEDRTQEYHDDTDGTKPIPTHDWVDFNRTCATHTGDEKKHCFNSILAGGSITPLWNTFHQQPGGFPEPYGYKTIHMHVGGAETRKTLPAWASWRQLWPTEEEETPTNIYEFDVSSIDTSNIPNLDCDKVFYHTGRHVIPSCFTWQNHPKRGIGGFFYMEELPTGGTLYYHLTTPVPTDQGELEELKEKLAPGHKDIGWKVAFIPVKHDFGQFWQWKVILDRFITSEANTIGILSVELETNARANETTPGSGDATWLPGTEPAGVDEYGSGPIWPAVRTILILGATNPPQVADALPHLLPLLGIPVDAVGLIIRKSHRPFRVYLTKEESDIPKTQENVPDAAIQNNSPTDQQAGSPPVNPVQDGSREPDHSFNQEHPGTNQQDQPVVTSPPMKTATEENRPDSSQTNNPSSTETGNSQWTIITATAVAGLAAVGLVAFLGLRFVRRRS